MNSLIKSIKKIKPQKGDFIIVTVKGDPLDYQLQQLKDKFSGMSFLKGTYVLFINDMINIRRAKENKGKHQVFLNNLEYLEYLSKKKEIKK